MISDPSMGIPRSTARNGNGDGNDSSDHGVHLQWDLRSMGNQEQVRVIMVKNSKARDETYFYKYIWKESVKRIREMDQCICTQTIDNKGKSFKCARIK